MIKYSELLPSYLQGSNISKHSSIIEEMDADAFNKIMFMRGWLELEQPVLVERVASETSITYAIHIHDDNIIKSIIITGDITENKTYSIEDMVTDITLTMSLANTDKITMHDFQVTITDYNDVSYTKGYPENDTTADNIYDHNEFIDKLGRLLNLPRKTYSEYNIADAKDTMPAYFGKEVNNNVVQSCTEDDYYYLQRIREYMEKMNHSNLPMLLLQLMYGYSRVELLDPELLSNQQIADNIEDQKPGLVEQITPGMYVFMVSALNPVNYPSLTEAEKQDFLEKYIPITRSSAIVELIQSILTITANNLHKVVSTFNYSLLTELEEQLNVPSATIDVTLDKEAATTLPVTNGAASNSYTTLPRGLHTIIAKYTGEYGYDTEITTLNFKRILDESGLRYVFHQPKKMDTKNNVSTIRISSAVYDVELEQLSPDHPDTAAYDVFGYSWIGGYDWTDTWKHIVVESESNYKFGLTDSFHDYRKDPANTSTAWTGELTGRHIISFQYKSDTIYIDGTPAYTLKNYTGTKEFKSYLLQILDKGGVATISHESRISHYMPNFTREIQENPAQIVLRQWQGILDNQYTVKLGITINSNPGNLRICMGDEEHNGFPLNGNNLNLSLGSHIIKYQYVHPYMYVVVDDHEVTYAYNFNTNQLLQKMQTEEWAEISQRNNITWNEYIQPVIYTNGECEYTLDTIEYCPETDLVLAPQPYVTKDIELSLECDVTSLEYSLIPGYVLPVTVTATSEGAAINNTTVTVEIYNKNKQIGQATITDGSVEVDCILDIDDADAAELYIYAKTRQGKVYNTQTSNAHTINILEAPSIYSVESFTSEIWYNNETVMSIPANRVQDANYVLSARVWDNRYNTPVKDMTVNYYYRSYTNGRYTNQLIATIETGNDGLATTQIPGNDITGVNLQDTSLEFIAVVEDVTPAHTSITMTSIDPYDTRINIQSNISTLRYSAMTGEIIQLHMQLFNDELQTPLAGQTIIVYDGNTYLAELTTANDGSVDYNYTINTPRLTNIEFNASYADATGNYNTALATQTITILDDRTQLSLVASPNSIPGNWLPYTIIELTATLTDGNNNPLPAGKTISITFPDETVHAYTTDRFGQITTQYAHTGAYDNTGMPFEAEYVGDDTYASATAEIRVGIEPSTQYNTNLLLTTTHTGTIDQSDITTVRIPITIQLDTNDSKLATQRPIANETVQIYQVDNTSGDLLLANLTTNTYGNATHTINGLNSTTDTEIELLAIYEDQRELYGPSSSSIYFTVNQITDPLADADFYKISNWGTYPANTSGASHTGATTAATTSDLTIDATAKTITDKNKKYFVYNKTLQDFLDYYNNEFSLIAYKTGGDGRYAYGFVNTTTGGYKLGYVDGYAKNEENNISLSEGEVVYQKYNEITYKKIGSHLHIYWKKQGTTYVEKAVALGNINPSEYYLYFNSSVRAGTTITNDRTKIQNSSRA